MPPRQPRYQYSPHNRPGQPSSHTHVGRGQPAIAGANPPRAQHSAAVPPPYGSNNSYRRSHRKRGRSAGRSEAPTQHRPACPTDDADEEGELEDPQLVAMQQQQQRLKMNRARELLACSTPGPEGAVPPRRARSEGTSPPYIPTLHNGGLDASVQPEATMTEMEELHRALRELTARVAALTAAAAGGAGAGALSAESDLPPPPRVEARHEDSREAANEEADTVVVATTEPALLVSEQSSLSPSPIQCAEAGAAPVALRPTTSTPASTTASAACGGGSTDNQTTLPRTPREPRTSPQPPHPVVDEEATTATTDPSPPPPPPPLCHRIAPRPSSKRATTDNCVTADALAATLADTTIPTGDGEDEQARTGDTVNTHQHHGHDSASRGGHSSVSNASHTDTTGSLIRFPPPRIATWNVDGLTVAKVAALVEQNKSPWRPDIWCLQELRTDDEALVNTLTQLGSVYWAPRSVGTTCGGGLGILVNTALVASNPKYCERWFGSNLGEWLAVTVSRPGSKVSYRIASVYMRPGPNPDWDRFLRYKVDRDDPPIDVFAGDFNARHPLWDQGDCEASPDALARGTALIEAAPARGFVRSNAGNTRVSTTWQNSATDMFLFSNSVTEVRHEVRPEMGQALSNHKIVILDIPAMHHGTPGCRVPETLWANVMPWHLNKVTDLLGRLSVFTPLDLHLALCAAVKILPRSSWHAQRPTPHYINADISTEGEAWRAVERPSSAVNTPTVPLWDLNGKKRITGPREKVASLNQFFVAMHAVQNESLRLPDPVRREGEENQGVGPTQPADHGNTTFPIVSRSDVRSAISRLGRGSDLDNDGLSMRFMKWCEKALLRPCTTSFTAILRDPSLIPSGWKLSTMSALLKDGRPPDQLSSYRPVSIDSLQSRVLEAIVAERIQRYTRGVKPIGSATDALDTIFGTALLVCDTTRPVPQEAVAGDCDVPTGEHGRCLMGYLDLTDASCQLSHVTILEKLRSLEVPTYLVTFVHWWLYGRSARTFFAGRSSTFTPLQAGVAQGSILGRLLFTLVMDDLTTCIDAALSRYFPEQTPACNTVAVYQDSVTIVLGGFDVEQMHDAMECVMTDVDTWCARRNITLGYGTVFQWLSLAPVAKSDYTTRLSASCGTVDPQSPSHAGDDVVVTSYENAATLAVFRSIADRDAARCRQQEQHEPPLASTPPQHSFDTPIANQEPGAEAGPHPHPHPHYRFPVILDGTHKLLGVIVDSRLTFHPHMTYVLDAGRSMLTRLEPVLARCPPHLARGLVDDASRTFTHGLDVLYAFACKRDSQFLAPLSSLWNTYRQCLGETATTAVTEDTLVEIFFTKVAKQQPRDY